MKMKEHIDTTKLIAVQELFFVARKTNLVQTALPGQAMSYGGYIYQTVQKCRKVSLWNVYL